jgi:hypothetical protein
MMSNADLSANIRAEIARQRRTYKAVADAAGMDPRQFRRRCREEVEWSGTELIAVAAALDIPLERLAREGV